MKAIHILFFSVLGAIGFATPSTATVIGVGGFSGHETVVNFTPGFSFTTSPVHYEGLTLSSPVSGLETTTYSDPSNLSNFPGASGGLALFDRVFQSDIRIEFPGAQTRIGMLLAGGNAAATWTLTAFDASNAALGSQSITFLPTLPFPASPPVFAGFEFMGGISSLRIVEQGANSQYTGIDDIRFEVVPEPGSIALLALPALFFAVRLAVRRAPRNAA